MEFPGSAGLHHILLRIDSILSYQKEGNKKKIPGYTIADRPELHLTENSIRPGKSLDIQTY